MFLQHFFEEVQDGFKFAAMRRMHRLACAFSRQELPLAPIAHRFSRTGRR